MMMNAQNFFNNFKDSTANLGKFTNGEAGIHVLEIRKYFKVYIKENNINFPEGADGHIDNATYELIYEFINLILHKITAAPPEESFENMKLIDKDTLFKVMSYVSECREANMKLANESYEIQFIASKYINAIDIN